MVLLLRNLNKFFFIPLITAAFALDSKPVVSTKYGKISGVATFAGQNRILTKFLGVPYAKPPLGNLRFKKPEQPNKWNGILNAENFKPGCNEYEIPINDLKFLNFSLPEVERSEDCLFLNIYIPGEIESCQANPKAVMFYIHGGALVIGSSNIYKGNVLALSEDVIVVTINYRLGLFGFMATDDNKLPGNQGLFDQQAALMWVNENIKEFGGDASRITIFGQSVGGDSGLVHLSNPASDKLFSQVIMQSAASVTNVRTKSQQYELLKKVFSTKCGEIKNTNIFLKCVQSLSTTEILALHKDAINVGMLFLMKDGEMLQYDFHELLLEGKFNSSKRIMVGYPRDDGDSSIIPFSFWESFVREGVNLTTARSMISQSFGFHLGEKSNVDIVEDLTFKKYIGCRTDPLEIARGILNMRTEVWFASKMHLIATTFAKYGGEVYLFRFDHFSEYVKEFMQANMELYAGHSHEMMYIWGSGYVSQVDTLFTTEEKLLSASIMKSFGEFAKTGKPKYLTKKGKIAKWKPYSYQTKQFLVFTTGMNKESLKLVPGDLQRRMKFLNTVAMDIWNTSACSGGV